MQCNIIGQDGPTHRELENWLMHAVQDSAPLKRGCCKACHQYPEQTSRTPEDQVREIF